MQRLQHCKRNAIGVLCILLLLFGMVADAFAPKAPGTPGLKPVPCITYDPQDEPPGQDYDSHNCPGVP